MNSKEIENINKNLSEIRNYFYGLNSGEPTYETLLKFLYHEPDTSEFHNLEKKTHMLANLVALATVFDTADKHSNHFSNFNYSMLERTVCNYLGEDIFNIKQTLNLLNNIDEWITYANANDVQIDFFTKERELIEDKLKSNIIILKNHQETINTVTLLLQTAKNNNDNERFFNKLMNSFIVEYKNNIGDSSSMFIEIQQAYKQLEITSLQVKTCRQKIIDYLKENHPILLQSYSDKYADHCCKEKHSDITRFLHDKEYDKDIISKIKLKGQSISEVIFFSDNTLVYNDFDEYKSVKNTYEFEDIADKLSIFSINYLLRKKPKVADFFKGFVEYESLSAIFTTIDTYLQFGDILKNNKFDLLSFTPDIFGMKSLEVIDDTMNSIIREHKIHQYANSIISKKYEHLMSKESLQQFQLLFDNGVSEKSLQNYIGKKMAALKSPTEFTQYVSDVVKHFTGFNIESISAKIIKMNIEPSYHENNVLVIPINSFEESKTLGSASWCIARSDYYFETYTKDNAQQYFLFDFNKKEDDLYSMIGFTVNKNGTLSAKHLKNDDNFLSTTNFENIYLTVVKNNLDKFSTLNDEIKLKIENNFNIKIEAKQKKDGLKI